MTAAADPENPADRIHRIGGGQVENLRMKSAEKSLAPPGISVLKGGSPAEAAQQMKDAFPNASKLHELARTVGSTDEKSIRSVGFDLFPDPTRKLPNHHRLIHPEGPAGFDDKHLGRLSLIFTDSMPGEES